MRLPLRHIITPLALASFNMSLKKMVQGSWRVVISLPNSHIDPLAISRSHQNSSSSSLLLGIRLPANQLEQSYLSSFQTLELSILLATAWTNCSLYPVNWV